MLGKTIGKFQCNRSLKVSKDSIFVVLTSVAFGVRTTIEFSFIGLLLFEATAPDFVDVPSLDLRADTDLLIVGLLVESFCRFRALAVLVIVSPAQYLIILRCFVRLVWSLLDMPGYIHERVPVTYT